MATIKLIIPGKPIAKKAPKFFRRDNYVGTYSDQQTEAGKVMLFISSQLKNHKPFECGVYISAIYYMPIPKSTSKKKIAKMMNGELLHIKKPDTDNLNKFYRDCLKGLAWKDDAQVVWSETKKMYSDNPCTELIIKNVEVLK